MHADLYLRKGEAYGSPLRLPPPRSNVRLFMMTGVEGPFCRKKFQYRLQIWIYLFIFSAYPIY
jgi:hypothetical protein